ncbi:hypothetical protein [Anaerovibrio lipolyticus]|uniref:hypothetical protein n=1 Tax=Anaerovibrio lipolyticus TaxID=82374 RepID=UPI0004852499|nr:hypothetical protein [Anaerovibrio lipolyticus]
MDTNISAENLILDHMALNTIYIISKEALAKFPDKSIIIGVDYKMEFLTGTEDYDLVCCYKFQRYDYVYYIFLNLTGWRHLLIINEPINEIGPAKTYHNPNICSKKAVEEAKELPRVFFNHFHLYYDIVNDKIHCEYNINSYMYRNEINALFHSLLTFLALNPSEHPDVLQFLQNNIVDRYIKKRESILFTFSKDRTTVSHFTYIDFYNESAKHILVAAVYIDQTDQKCYFLGGHKARCIDDSLRLSNNNKYYIDNQNMPNRKYYDLSKMNVDDNEFSYFIENFYPHKASIAKIDYYYDSGLLIRSTDDRIKIIFNTYKEKEDGILFLFKRNIVIDEKLQLKFKKLPKKAKRLDTEHYRKVIDRYLATII